MLGRLFKRTDFKTLIARGAVIIDVRGRSEFLLGESVPGSENIPLTSLSLRINEIKKLRVPIICVCASGMRSGAARSQLKDVGVDAYNGGSWTKMLPFVA